MTVTTAPRAATITVFLADDNLLVREGVRALIDRHPDLSVVGVAADYDETVAGATETRPKVLVTDIRMPPSFNREGIDAAKEVRKRHPGTGVVILSQYDDPEYAVSLLAEGSAGYGYLLEGPPRRGRPAHRGHPQVATGGTALDPAIVEALVRPVTCNNELSSTRRRSWPWSPRASPSRPSRRRGGLPPEAVDAQVEDALSRSSPTR